MALMRFGRQTARGHGRLARLHRCLCAFLAVLLLVGWALPGCGALLGPHVVSAPNKGKSIAALGDLAEQELDAKGVSRQLRVAVGPPEASLSLWVIEPMRKTVRVRMPSAPGTHTVAWEFSQQDRGSFLGEEPLGTIIVLHGIYDNKEKFGGFWGWIFAAAGYRAIVVDLRGHGRSTGDYMTYGVVEARDVSQVIDGLEDEGLISGRLGVFGVSYGGAVAIQAAAIDRRIDAVATLAAFSSFEEVVYPFGEKIVRRRLGDLGWTVLRGFVPEVVREAGRTGGFNPADASPRRAIARTTTPVLLMHGTNDTHVPCRDAQDLHAANPEHTQLVLIPNATHLSLVLRRVGQVRELSLDWFDQHLADTARRLPPGDGPAIATGAPTAQRLDQGG